jgi:hypothetical protein
MFVYAIDPIDDWYGWRPLGEVITDAVVHTGDRSCSISGRKRKNLRWHKDGKAIFVAVLAIRMAALGSPRCRSVHSTARRS